MKTSYKFLFPILALIWSCTSVQALDNEIKVLAVYTTNAAPHLANVTSSMASITNA